MKKIFTCLLLAVALVLCMASCTKGGDTASVAHDVTAMASSIGAVAGIQEPADYTDTELTYDISLDMADVASFAGTYTTVNGASGMVLVIEAADGKADTVKAALETYRTSTADFLANYPEHAEAAKQAGSGIVSSKGNYIVLAIAAEGVNYADVQSAVDTALQ